MLIMYSQKLYRAFTVSVSLASTSLLVPAQNALSFVRKYGLEFFQPLAAPPTYQKPRLTDTIEPSYGHRAGLASGDAEAAEKHQTRRWRSSRDAGGHGDSRVQRASSNGGGRAELRLNAAGQRK